MAQDLSLASPNVFLSTSSFLYKLPYLYIGASIVVLIFGVDLAMFVLRVISSFCYHTSLSLAWRFGLSLLFFLHSVGVTMFLL